MTDKKRTITDNISPYGDYWRESKIEAEKYIIKYSFYQDKTETEMQSLTGLVLYLKGVSPTEEIVEVLRLNPVNLPEFRSAFNDLKNILNGCEEY